MTNPVSLNKRLRKKKKRREADALAVAVRAAALEAVDELVFADAAESVQCGADEAEVYTVDTEDDRLALAWDAVAVDARLEAMSCDAPVGSTVVPCQ